MELLTLNSQFQPVKLIENYETLIWSERYLPNGDFELHSRDIGAAMTLLPEGSYVTLRDSVVPMIVEDHAIQKPKNEGPKVVITGRSFDTVLDRRVSIGSSLNPTSQRTAWMQSADKQSDAAYIAMRRVLGDIARSQGGTQILSAVAPAVSPLDAIPEINLPLPADFSTGATNSYEIKASDLYSAVIDLLQASHHGLKAVRPLVDTKTTVDIEIYNGADLTETVVFDARFDQIDAAKYLLSARTSKNIAYVYGSTGADSVRKNTVGPEVGGLARRVLLVDEQSDSTLSNTTVRKARGLVELYKNNATALFDGETAIQVAEGYTKTYHLGDIVKLTGEYGLSTNVRVAEFIRTQDAEGERAYPTFEAVDE